MRGAIALTLAACLLAACGSGSDGGEDTSLPDVIEDVTDTSEEVADDVQGDLPLSDTDLCTPAGRRRCTTIDRSPAVEICSGEGEWEAETCAGDEICADRYCGVAGSCEPFTEITRCVDCRTYLGCSPLGHAVGEFSVPQGKVCVEDEGGARLVDWNCVPETRRCTSDFEQELCDPCGLQFVERDCRDEEQSSICDADDGRCKPLCEFIEKQETYVGCEYWAVDLDNAFLHRGGGNYLDAAGKKFAIVVSNVHESLDAAVTVSDRNGVIVSESVPPGELRILEMPPSNINGTMVGYEAFKVESSIPIIAYQFNPLDNVEEVFSNDASILFPTTSLGTDYIVMTRRQTFDTLKGYVTVIGTQGTPEAPTTRVEITLPPYTADNPVITLANEGQGIPVLYGGDTITIELEPFQLINIETNRPGADLTGTVVSASRSVAVFGGSEASNAPNTDSCVYRVSQQDWVCAADRSTPCLNDNDEPDIRRCSQFVTCCADHLEHQMLPVSAWGRRFNAVHSVRRGDEADVWRVIAGSEDTTVTLSGLPDPNDAEALGYLQGQIPQQRQWTVGAGEWFEFESPVDFEIFATGPIMVGQFLAAEQAPYPNSTTSEQPPHTDAGTGDPAFILVPPIEQYRNEYTFLAPNAYEFDYVSITAPDFATVYLDGEEITDDEWEAFGENGFRAARRLVADGVHTIAADFPVGVMVHGYDRFVSYGYPAGLDLRSINE